MNQAQWEFYIDRGGTFTDVIAYHPQHGTEVEKLLSHNPSHYLDASCEGIRRILNRHGDSLFTSIQQIRMGTTVATNALLERKGEDCALVITQGFADVLKIAYQNRKDLFALEIKRTPELYAQVIEVDERIAPNGEIITPLDTQSVTKKLMAIKKSGIASVAIVLMHAYANNTHEKEIAEIAKKIGFNYQVCSHQVSGLMKIVNRGQTTVVDAYLTPCLRQYVEQITDTFPNNPIYFMQSNGGLCQSQNFVGRNSILSGPAGGVIGAIKTAQAAGFEKIIGFDMGGTSTDVCHYAGTYERNFESDINGIRLNVPMMNIHTIAAGGGSILHFSDGRFQVGPDSAGATPGPMCYRNQGPLTITDANLLLGKIPFDFFPKIFGPHQNQGPDIEKVKHAFQSLAQRINQQYASQLTPQQVAEGFLDVAIAKMASAIKSISTQRGIDTQGYVLNCFGGAGAQHACLIAEKLNLSNVLVHPFAPMLSALGIAYSDIRNLEQKTIEAPLSNDRLQLIKKMIPKISHRLASNFSQQDKLKKIRYNCHLFVKYSGSDYCLELVFNENFNQLVTDFNQQHLMRYGFKESQKKLIIESIAVEAIIENQKNLNFKLSTDKIASDKETIFFSKGQQHQAIIANIDKLKPNKIINGPALLISNHTSIVVEPSWYAFKNEHNHIILHHRNPGEEKNNRRSESKPILLEIFNNLFMSIAEQMGSVLVKTAHSVNIKERRDYSCALFDKEGNLIANAPHMPVHLGSMSESVKSILHQRGSDIQRGESYLINNPYRGGTHLPDMTVITPMFWKKKIIYFIASRGHHADVGGITPGSLPAHSKSIFQEGIIFDDFCLCKDGVFQEQEILKFLTKYKARSPLQNIADLKAQLAANHQGILLLTQAIESFGLEEVLRYSHFVMENAELAVKKALSRLQSGSYQVAMDNGAKIQVDIRIDKANAQAVFDFSGTSPQQNNNFNAPKAVTQASVLYVLRTLVEHEIPLNEGCLNPIKLLIPEKSLLNPEQPAAVVAGNVETSQCIVDCLYAALGIQAGAQGTMNNFTFGNQHYQYYETICGGTGAGFNFNGCDAIHSHMTNSLITDPEVLETRFPVRLLEFSIRKHSGGKGKYHGGDGAIRRILFLESMECNILSNRRLVPPHGLAGGQTGRCGINRLLRKDTPPITLDSAAQVVVKPGDIIVIETPGGGGYGSAEGSNKK